MRSGEGREAMSDWHFQKYPDIVAFKQQLLLKSIPELEEIRERCIAEMRANDPERDVTYTHVVSGDSVYYLGTVDDALRFAREAREALAKR
jgi:hypothetical protein